MGGGRIARRGLCSQGHSSWPSVSPRTDVGIVQRSSTPGWSERASFSPSTGTEHRPTSLWLLPACPTAPTPVLARSPHHVDALAWAGWVPGCQRGCISGVGHRASNLVEGSPFPWGRCIHHHCAPASAHRESDLQASDRVGAIPHLRGPVSGTSPPPSLLWGLSARAPAGMTLWRSCADATCPRDVGAGRCREIGGPSLGPRRPLALLSVRPPAAARALLSSFTSRPRPQIRCGDPLN